MTYTEKYIADNSGTKDYEVYDTKSSMCPHHFFHIADVPDYCSGLNYDICEKCWNREVPNEEKTKDEQSTTKKDSKDNVNNDSISLPRILDSGTRRKFETGAVRDIQEGKGRCDLLPLDVVADLFYYKWMDKESSGCNTVPVISNVFECINSFVNDGDIKHLYEAIDDADIFKSYEDMLLEVSKHFEEGAKKYGDSNWQKGIPVRCYIDSAVRHYLKYLKGDKDEPHDRAFCWNLMCAIWTCKHKPELNDYKTCNTKEEC